MEDHVFIITHVSRHTLMGYFVLSPNGKESFNTFLSPDLDPYHLREEPSTGILLRVKKSSQSERQLSCASGQT